MNRELLEKARAGLPKRLNAGILQGDGGFCILGWLLVCAGYHPITIYGSTLAVIDARRGGRAIDVVAREYGLEPAAVADLSRLNDGTASVRRVEAVRKRLDALLGAAS
jgi:hypothetical protein